MIWAMASFINREENELNMGGWHTQSLGTSRHFRSGESPGQTWDRQYRLMRSLDYSRAGTWSFLTSRWEWSQKGREGPLKAVTRFAGPCKGWEWGWGGLPWFQGCWGCERGTRGFIILFCLLLLLCMFNIFYPKIKKKKTVEVVAKERKKKV